MRNHISQLGASATGLSRFLETYPELQWTLQLRVGRCAAATQALAQSASATADFAAHLRLVALAKLSSRAAGDATSEEECSTKLRLLEIQVGHPGNNLSIFSLNLTNCRWLSSMEYQHA